MVKREKYMYAGYKKKLGGKLFDSINLLIMFIMLVISIYPLLYVLFSSLSEPSKLIQHQGVLLWPKGFTLKGYSLVFKNPNVVTGYMNTIIYVVTGTALNLFLTSIGGYALSRKDVRLKKIILLFIAFTMLFSGGLIPRFLLIKDIGLMDNRLVMILPTAIITWNLFIMRTSFANIPYSFEEAAKIDGANDFTILFRIILPIAKPTVAVMVLYYGVHHWNAWADAMIFLRDSKKIPLQLVLRQILIMNDTERMIEEANSTQSDLYESLVKYCTIIVATVPVLTLYPFLQKYFVKGIMVGGVKG